MGHEAAEDRATDVSCAMSRVLNMLAAILLEHMSPTSCANDEYGCFRCHVVVPGSVRIEGTGERTIRIAVASCGIERSFIGCERWDACG